MTETPPNPVAAPAAPLWRRLAAAGYDLLALIALWLVVGAVWVALNGSAIAAGDPIFRAVLLLAAFGYYGYCWRGGQTLGMRAWRIRVTSAAGMRLTWPLAAQRFAVALIGLACLGAGLWWALLDARGRMWHDLATGTEVVAA